MRFVSHSPNFMVQVISERTHVTQYGGLITDREGYIAKFNQNDVIDADLEFAEKVLVGQVGINGRTTDADEVTLSPLIQRVSVFDTEEQARREQWGARTYVDDYGKTHDFREYVEGWLAQRAATHGDFRLVTEILPEPPWPNYLEYRGSLDSLMERLLDDGFDLGEVLRYEEKVAKREQVIERLRAEIGRGANEAAQAAEVVRA